MKKYFITICTLFVLAPQLVFASRIYFQPQEEIAGTSGDFVVAVLMDATQSVNAIEGVLNLPQGVTVKSVSTGNSIISMFVQTPTVTNDTVSFSGIIPGGYQGEGGTLFTVTLLPTGGERMQLSFAQKPTVYLAQTPGVKDVVSTENVTVAIAEGKRNMPVNPPDFDMPEPIVYSVASSADVYDGKLFLSFVAQDKGSGVDRYEIAETYFPHKKLNWKEVQSPYVLTDQKQSSYVYVRAIDEAGNVRVAVVDPRTSPSWWVYVLQWEVLVIILALLLAVAVYNRRK